MEYVKNAIEKARADRQGNAAETGAQTGAAPKPDIRDDSAVNVNYSQTKSVSLNMQHLLANRVIAIFDDDERAEPYRHLRTQILQQFRDHQWRSLALTSAQSGAGKTLTAVNLAIALAKELNQTVLLVDVDFKDPSVCDTFGIEVEYGLVDHLSADIPLADIMVNPGLERLTILPALPVEGSTSEILSSPKMKAILDEIVNRYSDRFIIFDLPPLLRDDDALVFTPYADASLLVVENGATTPNDLERCVQLLNGTNLLGTIFNKAD